MNANNIGAESIESSRLLTCSTQEMAFNILGLMSPDMVQLCQANPVYADLSGGWQSIQNLQQLLKASRSEVKEKSTMRKALSLENSLAQRTLSSSAIPRSTVKTHRKANMQLAFPKLQEYEPLLDLNLRGMTDLSRIVVICGFSELGPLGNSRTRWDFECARDFSLEGYIEMAWIMGLIKHTKGVSTGSKIPRPGWVDVKTNELVEEYEIPARYGAHIRQHSGIRLVDPAAFGGYDPRRKELLHEVVIEEDLEPFEASRSLAEAFKLQHGDKVSVHISADSEEAEVQLKRGAVLLVPKAVSFSRLVAAQIPTGWDPKRYGIPEDLVQVGSMSTLFNHDSNVTKVIDPITLYVLCAAAEALLSAGITDPFEIYKYIHVSMLGNCIGSGAGGAHALRGMYRERYLDNSVQMDVLQETFINTVGAWLNMTLLGSTGTNRTPVGACATSLESLDIGYDAIVSGKAKMCFVGGTDDFNEELSQEFANM
jgi:fatty acid synthase subunit alpha